MAEIAPPSTAVDLSRLPAPTMIEQLSYEAILAEMVARVQAELPSFDATVESDPAVKVLQTAAYRELILRQDFNDRLLQCLVAFAEKANLDHLAAQLDVARLVLVEPDPETGAEAVMEGDDALRERILLAPEAMTVAGTESSYIAAARRASGDVLHASAISPEPAEVLVSVLSRIGDGAASPELIAAVEAVVNHGEVRPLTDLVTVQSAEIVNFAVVAQLKLFSGPDAAIVLASAQARLDAYCAAVHRLGRRVTLTGIIGALQVEGVEEVILAEPSENIDCDRTQAPWCTGTTITVAP